MHTWSMIRSLLGAMILAAALGWAGSSAALTEETEHFKATIEGQKTWTLRYGFGDPYGLALSGLAPGQLVLDQTFTAEIKAEALSVLTLEAHFDDRVDQNLQSLTVRLDTEHLDGILGDFVILGLDEFTAYNKKMKGVRLDYTLGDLTVTAVGSKLEGVLETKTFVGQTAHEELWFSAMQPERPWVPQPYLRHLDGLYAYRLTERYVAEFSAVRLVAEAGGRLRETLAQYGLDYLIEVFVENPEWTVPSRLFAVVGAEDQTLILKRKLPDLVREWIEAAIESYNEAHELSGADARTYPFSPNSEFELGFLAKVAGVAQLAVGETQYPLSEPIRRRFYDLGRTKIQEGTVSIEVSLDGETFESITEPDYADYNSKVDWESGVVELSFPEAFFARPDAAIRISFDYAVSGGMYMLGLSIIPESERVLLNGRPLVREKDYQVDYELGMLILLVEVQDADVIRVDYERYGGGLGGAAEYATYFYGLSLSLPLSESMDVKVSLLRSADDPGSAANPDTVRTMPNTHTIAGVVGAIQLDGFQADLMAAYNHDEYPFDDNQRIHRPNEVRAIAAGEGYTFFGDSAGLSAYRDGTWRRYTVSDGLAGRGVRAIAVDEDQLYLGTSGGLTVVRLVGSAPLDRVGNWYRYYEEDGLPSNQIHALALVGGTLWIGTEAGLVSVRAGGLSDPGEWTLYAGGGFADLPEVRAIRAVGRSLYLGTVDGLYRYELDLKTLESVPETSGEEIRDLQAAEGTLYIASDRGLRTMQDGVGTGWIVLGEPVHAVTITDGTVWYGTDHGAVAAVTGEVAHPESAITALGVDEAGGLWLGSRADADYALVVWRRSPGRETAFPSTITKIEGRDPLSFLDIPADAHTREGVYARAAFRRDGDGFSLSGVVEHQPPDYRSIGAIGRRDATGWSLSGSTELGGTAKLAASHEYRVSDLSSPDSEARMANDLSFAWSAGPNLSIGVQHESVNEDPYRRGEEYRRVAYQLSLQDRLFDDSFRVGLSWRDAYSTDLVEARLRRDTRLGIESSVQFTPTFSAKGSWTRPIQESDGSWSGRENWNLHGAWTGRLIIASVGLDYDWKRSRSLTRDDWTTTHRIDADIRPDRVDLLSWRITPDLRLSLVNEDRTWTFDGRVQVRSEWDALSVRATFGGDVSGLYQPLQRENQRLSVTASYSGFESVRPSLTYNATRSGTTYQGQTVFSRTETVNGRITWSPKGSGQSDTLSFTVKTTEKGDSRTLDVAVDNEYRQDLTGLIEGWWASDEEPSGFPTVMLRANTNGRYKFERESRDLSVSATGRLDLALSPMWGGSLGATAVVGSRSDRPFYASGLLELTVAITF